jgi:hypothetical protein
MKDEAWEAEGSGNIVLNIKLRTKIEASIDRRRLGVRVGGGGVIRNSWARLLGVPAVKALGEMYDRLNNRHIYKPLLWVLSISTTVLALL